MKAKQVPPADWADSSAPFLPESKPLLCLTGFYDSHKEEEEEEEQQNAEARSCTAAESRTGGLAADSRPESPSLFVVFLPPLVCIRMSRSAHELFMPPPLLLLLLLLLRP